ncbi:MAG: PAS domain-containing protein [Chloroflexota bacterium]|nr:MAG: PAS domain-containing protein [Chloroflexota bacterium]
MPQSKSPLFLVIIGTAIGSAVLEAAVMLIWGSERVAVLPWYAPMMNLFNIVVALSAAFLAFGRYRVLRQPLPFWIGLGFSSVSVTGLAYTLSFPGLLPTGGGVIAQLPNTSTWISAIGYSILSISLLIAVVARWPQQGMPGERWAFWLILATLAAVVAIVSLSIAFEEYLPVLVTLDGEFTPALYGWYSAIAVLFVIDAVFSTHRYRQTGVYLLGYLPLLEVLQASAHMAIAIPGRRYAVLWYLAFVFGVSAFTTMLFGLLSEYVELYRRERDKTVELENKTVELENKTVELENKTVELENKTGELEGKTVELERLREDAQRRAAELQTILDNMVDGVFVCDVQGHLILVNEAGRRLLGATSADDVTQRFAELLVRARLRRMDGTPIQPDETALLLALRGETIMQEDAILFNPRAKRDIYIRSSAAPIRDEKGRTIGAVAVTRDITDLTELDRLKDQFMLVAAHELKTPVTGVKGYAQLLLQREHEGVSPFGLKALEAINRQSDRISRLVNELLDMTRLQTGSLDLHLAQLDLSELAASTVARMRLATEQHALLFQSPDPVLVDGDRGRLEEVLSALLDNAVRYSPHGGEIETTVCTVEGQAVVSVRDYGVGIPEDKQSRIFERFYRAHTGTPYDYGGMGVALFISREIIARHGGRMWFESEEGKGSTFYFSLPLAS